MTKFVVAALLAAIGGGIFAAYVYLTGVQDGLKEVLKLHED